MTDTMAAVAAATASVPRLYALNDAPSKPTYPYGAYSASLGRGDSHTLDSAEGVRWGRVVVQTFGHTATAALDLAETARAALVGTSLDITGYDASPLRAELDPAVRRDPDDYGVVGVTATYTFTVTKES
jgi:hypothetical protein